MNDATTKPVFLGGTIPQHLLFIVAIFRFQHHSLPLAFLHYPAWAIVGVALHVLAVTVGGPLGSIVVFGLAVTAWAVRLDVRVGLLFGLMQAAYAWTTVAVVQSLMPASRAAAVGLALAAIVGGIMAEVAGHHVLQGYGPRPPSRALVGLSRAHRLAFPPYVIVTFGVFFLSLELAMRLVGHRRELNRQVNALAAEWHEDAVAAAASGHESRELRLHRRALAEL